MASSRPEAAPSNFAFLAAEWPEIHEAAAQAERAAHPDPRTACFYTRRALEGAVTWLYRHDTALRLPYQDHLGALLHESSFRQTVGAAVFTKAKLIKDLGNQAVHGSRPVRAQDAITAVRELFHVCFWLGRTYARRAKPSDALRFDPGFLPTTSSIAPLTRERLERLKETLAERDARLTALMEGRASLDAELIRLREEVARTKAANAAHPDAHDCSEAKTRDAFIDVLLREAGWLLDQTRDREFEVAGMANESGVGTSIWS